MAEFTSAFWPWYIGIIVIASIVGLVILVRWQSGGRPSDKPETMGHVWDGDLQEYNNPLPGWWLKLFYITLFFGIGYLILFPGLGMFKGVLGWTETGQYEAEMKKAEETYGPIYAGYQKIAIPELARNTEAMKTGGRLFATYCTVCHGSDARGAKGFPNLRDAEWLYGNSPEAIEATILNGRGGAMPAWEGALGKEGVANVVQYVLSLSGRKVDEAAAKAGEEKFKQMCIACHGPDGKGNTAIGAPNLTNDIWLYGGSQADVTQTVAHGRNGQMPAHKNLLGEARVHLLAAYIYSLTAVSE